MAMVTSRDASFSSYLNTNEETFLRKLAEQKASRNLSDSQLGDQHKQLGSRKKEEEDEIGVFGAEKYFNGVMDEDSSTKSSSSTSSSLKFHGQQQRVNLDHMKLKVHHQPGTPSVRSESSWNSQSALLRTSSKNPHMKTTSSKSQRKSFFASLGCSCSDKNSVDVSDEHVGEISFKQNGAATNYGVPTTPTIKKSLDLVGEALVKIKQGGDSWVKEEILINKEKIDKLGAAGLGKENCFTFPASKTGAVSSLPIKLPKFQDTEDERVRKSLEVFGSPVLEKRKKALGLEKRITMLAWDPEFPGVAISGGAYNHESDSDASSDLFEIESLTGKNNPFLARQASDGSATPTNGYAPSEASIEWSVVTASAADFNSAMSDCEDQFGPNPTTRNAKTSRMSKEVLPLRHRPTVLLGCKSHKSVKVAANAHRPYNQKTNSHPQTTPPPRKTEIPFMPSTRFQAETNTRLPGQHALAPRSYPRSQSPHAPHLLFMQQ